MTQLDEDLRQGPGATAWEELRERLARQVGRALRRSRATGSRELVSLTVSAGDADPVAVVAAARLPGESWFALEQPERDRMALAALGSVRSIEAEGPDRFRRSSRMWREIAGQALSDPPAPAAGSGLVALGGFSFGPSTTGHAWSGFSPASLHVPQLSLARRGDCSWLTLNLSVAPDDAPEELIDSARRDLLRLRQRPLPLLEPEPVRAPRVSSVMPPSHYEEAVARAVQRIRAGEFEKIVLAREVEVSGYAPDPFALLGVLRESFGSCYVYGVGRGERTLVGATPELLVRREGQRVSTVALAGSTRRSADPAVDDHLAQRLMVSVKDREENAIVARRIARSLEPHSLWVAASPEPHVIKVANIQHLAAPIRAQLARPLGALELAELLHPTPAVGGEPREPAMQAIPALEGFDRGWYAGTLGWTDASGDGEFCVALRCALIAGATSRLYAGCGIVRDSDPAAELAETEVKLAALLPLLAG
jgi:isochorismate synthase